MANIIDGIDVSKCEHLFNEDGAKGLYLCRINFDNNYFSNGIPLAEKCKKHKDCYYKQLKRAEQENEKLKEEIKALNQELDVGYIKYPAARNQIATLYGLPIQTWKDFKEKSITYKQALMDIREIAGSIIGDANATYTEFFEKLSNILDKINEVIGAE